MAKVVDGNRLLIQFSSVQAGIYALGKAHMHPNPSLRSFPNVAFKTVSNVRLIDEGPLSPFEERSSGTSLSTSLLQAIDGVISSFFTCNRSVSQRNRSNTRPSIRLIAILCSLSCLEHTHSVLHLFIYSFLVYAGLDLLNTGNHWLT